MLLYSTDCLKRNSKMKNKEQHTFPFIERLLDGAEVEWKPLGEVAEIGTGSSNRKDEDENGTYPFYVRSKNILRSSTYQFNETAIIIPGEGGIGDIYHFVKGKYALHQRAYRVHLHTNELLDKFVYHFMRANFKAYIVSKSVGATATSIRKPMLENFFIPIPPIAVQEEIVDILDKFTELEAELEAELEGRKRQYEYYRNHLLSFDMLNRGGQRLKNVTNNQLFHDNKIVEWLPIGSITKYEQPTNYLVKSTNYHESYATPVLTAGKTFILGYTNEENGIYKASKTPVIIFDDFTTANKWVNFDFKAKSSAMKMITSKDESKVLLRYIYYWLNTLPTEIAEGDHKRQWISSFCSKKIPIPCPSKPEKSLEIQRKIVSILDKFDTLTTSISEGLPKEIELRRKQYEFYRDKLLSFA